MSLLNDTRWVLNYGILDLRDVMGNDLTVVNAARVSFAKRKEEVDDKDARLIRYLAEHKHWTPFAHPQLTFYVKAPISVQRQFTTHRVGTVMSSESTRYVVKEPEFYMPRGFRQKVDNLKQGSGEYLKGYYDGDARTYYGYAMTQAYKAYKELLEAGVAPEVARDVLPLATFTEWYWTASLYAVANFISQRTGEGAQQEVGEYARAMRQIVEPYFPIALPALLGQEVA